MLDSTGTSFAMVSSLHLEAGQAPRLSTDTPGDVDHSETSAAQFFTCNSSQTSRIRSMLSFVTRTKLYSKACAAIQRSFSWIPSSRDVTGSINCSGRSPLRRLGLGAYFSNMLALSEP